MKQEIIKKDFVKENQEILARWKQSNETRYEETNFAPDGIMFRGEIVDYESWRERESGSENEIWTNAPLRILFILMDFPNDSERSWIVGHHFDSTVWFMDIFCAHRGVTPLAARPPLERD